MKLRLRTATAVVLAGLLLAGCDQKGSDAKHIKVGVINGAEQDVAEVAKKVAKEKYGLDVELVGFSGSLLPNESTNAGDLDANVFQTARPSPFRTTRPTWAARCFCSSRKS